MNESVEGARGWPEGLKEDLEVESESQSVEEIDEEPAKSIGGRS